MTREKKSKSVYCKDQLEKIENYQQAKADNFAGWCIHHKLEIQQDKRVSRQELKDKDLYFHRPASELVFMKVGEHVTLHNTDRYVSEATRQKMSANNAGKNNPMYGKPGAFTGKHHTDESRQKMSESHKGKHHSVESRRKMSEAHKGKHKSAETRHRLSEAFSGEHHPLFGKHHSVETRKKMSEANCGMLWWNNGISSKRSRECPGEGWKRGMFKKEAK